MKNITSPRKDASTPLERTSMRTSWTQPAGGGPAFIHEARVIDVNYVTWTVDVRTQFDQKFFPDVQVCSPYMHANRGEGIYAMPEVNAKCYVCLPSDGPPPFILGFIMPMETSEDVEGDDETEAAKEKTGTTTGAVFSGGRSRAKPGDITIKGRDGNFITLHRGGVLQIGSTELAQRLYIPLGNIVTDISQQYEHHNTGGSINWGLSTSGTDQNPETEWRQTFRLYANSEFADVRVAVGKVHQPVLEPVGDEGETSANNTLGIGKSATVFEVVVAPGGFNAESGTPNSDTAGLTKLRFFVDADGNAMVRAEGSVNIRVKEKLRLSVDKGIEVLSKGPVTITAQGLARLQGAGIQLTATGGSVVVNGGDAPVATVGSLVDIVVVTPVPIVVGGVPGTITTGARFTGVVRTGSPTFLAPRAG